MLLKTSTLLLEGLADPRNRAIWDEFDGRYRPVLAAFARRMGLSENDADEIAQEVLARFVERFRAGEYVRDRGRLRSWIFGIARTRIADSKRARARRRVERGTSALFSVKDETDPEAAFADEWRRALLRQAFAELRAKSRHEPKSLRALELLVLEQRPTKEVAQELGMTANALYVARHRALQSLRTTLARLEREF
jgi:RNA polymerase sigma-70 factor (ECF subfamily)